MAAKKKDNFQVYVKQIEAISKVANLITSGMYLEELLRLVVHVTAEIMAGIKRNIPLPKPYVGE